MPSPNRLEQVLDLLYEGRGIVYSLYEGEYVTPSALSERMCEWGLLSKGEAGYRLTPHLRRFLENLLDTTGIQLTEISGEIANLQNSLLQSLERLAESEQNQHRFNAEDEFIRANRLVDLLHDEMRQAVLAAERRFNYEARPSSERLRSTQERREAGQRAFEDMRRARLALEAVIRFAEEEGSRPSAKRAKEVRDRLRLLALAGEDRASGLLFRLGSLLRRWENWDRQLSAAEALIQEIQSNLSWGEKHLDKLELQEHLALAPAGRTVLFPRLEAGEEELAAHLPEPVKREAAEPEVLHVLEHIFEPVEASLDPELLLESFKASEENSLLAWGRTQGMEEEEVRWLIMAAWESGPHEGYVFDRKITEWVQYLYDLKRIVEDNHEERPVAQGPEEAREEPALLSQRPR